MRVEGSRDEDGADNDVWHGRMIITHGYNVKVINLLEMDKSDCYNPFSYIREETDVVKLITNIMSNTTPKGSTPSDPFWEKAEGLFLQALKALFKDTFLCVFLRGSGSGKFKDNFSSYYFWLSRWLERVKNYDDLRHE